MSRLSDPNEWTQSCIVGRTSCRSLGPYIFLSRDRRLENWTSTAYGSAVDWQTARATRRLVIRSTTRQPSIRSIYFKQRVILQQLLCADWDCVDARREIPVTQNWEARQSRRCRQRWPALAKSPISDCRCTFLNTAIIDSTAPASDIWRSGLAAYASDALAVSPYQQQKPKRLIKFSQAKHREYESFA